MQARFILAIDPAMVFSITYRYLLHNVRSQLSPRLIVLREDRRVLYFCLTQCLGHVPGAPRVPRRPTRLIREIEVSVLISSRAGTLPSC